VVIVALVALMAVLNGWAFPVERAWVALGALVLGGLLVASFRVRAPLARLWVPSAVAILLAEFLLNTSFYPHLGRYQPGRHLAAAAQAAGIDWERTYYLEKTYQPLQFYARRLIRQVDLDWVRSEVASGRELFLVLSEEDARRVRDEGLPQEVVATSPDCRVLNLKARFVNPHTRDHACETAFLLAVGRR
jgi:hypothetical protein